MRAMSFKLTTDQMRRATKTVTRRLGWEQLRVGEQISACVQCMGLKRGQHREEIGVIEITAITREPLDAITKADCIAEGFPKLNPPQFVAMFCDHHPGCTPATIVTRIEFKHLAAAPSPPAATRRAERSAAAALAAG